MKTEIFAVTHGDNKVPSGANCLPIVAGAAMVEGSITPGYLRDDSGENISEKNPNYCELTALYWIWKNSNADITGLCHYRRFYASLCGDGRTMGYEEAEHLLKYFDIIVPKARRYYIESNYSHYANAHHAADLDMTRIIIEEQYPEYLRVFDRCMSMRSGHRFNMLIMKSPLMDEYCSWLFGILFELEKRLDISGYDEYDRRVFGFVAERLLDVFIEKNELRQVETAYIFTGKEHLPIKALKLTARKLGGSIQRRKATH